MFGNLVRIIFRVIEMAIPWLIRLLGLAFNLMTLCITSIFVGIPQSIDRIANSWIEQATEAGLPASYHPGLIGGARVVAVIALILGWMVLASFTIWLFRMVF